MWKIRQVAERSFEVIGPDGLFGVAPTVGRALTLLASGAGPDALTAAGAPDGALADGWTTGPDGMVGKFETGETPDNRDFTSCTFTWRDVPLPLMLMTSNDFGHYGAELCGWIDTISMEGNHVAGSGFFHNTDAGVQARDVIQAQGRLGCSVDPGAVDAEWTCTEEAVDDWGPYCVAGVLTFNAYEVAGLTLLPFPAFAQCFVVLDGAASSTPASADTVAADARPTLAFVAAAAPPKPPRAWFEMPEPDADSPLMVPQPGGGLAVPLTITEHGQVYGHLATWTGCHTGYASTCVRAPQSSDSYPWFRVGEVVCDDDTRVATGALTVGCDHAALTLGAPEARDWYAHAGLSWADGVASNGRQGPWFAGALRPGLTDEQVRVVQALAPSGDWRKIAGRWEMVGVLTVNIPGFPVARSMAASAFEADVASVEERVRYVALDEPVALVAAGMVRPAPERLETLVAAGALCGDCAARAKARVSEAGTRPIAADRAAQREMQALLRTMAAQIQAIDRRTRHLNGAAAADTLARLDASLAS